MRSSLSPRYWFALFLGLFSAFLLSILLTNGEVSARLKRPDEPVLTSTGTVKTGETLSVILNGHGLHPLTAYEIQKTIAQSFNLRHMKPGDEYAIITSTVGDFREFQYKTDPIHSFLVIRSTAGLFSVKEREQKTVWMEKTVTCEVTENLYTDLLNAGYDERFVANLVSDLADNIFAWRIDFFTEQRPGDKLEVLMEQEFRLGSEKPLWGGRGRILAAAYTGRATKNKQNFAYRFLAPGESRPDYFDENGKAVRKAFLRTPFTHGSFRISSYFNLHRFHPIKRVYRPHHGIDYAAPTGTPVAAVGRGRVIFAGWKGGYGKTIEIRHSRKYTSRYGHLSRIGVKTGRWVEQGTTIGRVGSTGLATGPHLHFEMIVDGIQRNFLRLNFPAAKSILAKNLDEFKKVRDDYKSRLNARLEMAAAVTP